MSTAPRAPIGVVTGPAKVSVVRSPCTSVCKIDVATGFCEGCRRSLDEIAGWSAMDDAAKLAVWRLLRARRIAATAPLPPAAA